MWRCSAAKVRSKSRRIEEGKFDIASVIYGMPMTIEFVLALRDQLKNGKIDVREIVPIQETEEDFEEEQQPVERDYEELRVKTLEALNSVRKVSLALKGLAEKGRISVMIQSNKRSSRSSSMQSANKW